MANKKTSKENLETLIDACYPLVYILSAEEPRVLTSIEAICKARKFQFSSWSITKGLVSHPVLGGCSSNATEPGPALAYVEKNQARAGVVVLRDFHPYLKNPQVVRALRDVVEAFRSGDMQRTLVIVSPVFEVPTEIEKSVAVIDWALPSRDNLFDLAVKLVHDSGCEAPVSYETVVDAALGLTEIEAENAFKKSSVETGTLDPKAIHAEKKQIIKKSGQLEFIDVEESEATVGGLENLKSWLHERKNAFTAKARAFRLPKPRGIVNVGPQGTGKSLMAKVVAAMLGMPLVRFDIGAVFAGLVGSSEANMRAALKVISAFGPVVLQIDEIEKHFGGMNGSTAGDSNTGSRVFATFLTWLQETEAPVFVVATANAIDTLPPELLRKGRFDEIWFLDLPKTHERAQIFKIHLKKVGREMSAATLTQLAEACAGFSGAEIEAAIGAGLYKAFAKDMELSATHVMDAIQETTPMSKTAGEKIDRLRQWAADKARPANVNQEAIAQFVKVGSAN